MNDPPSTSPGRFDVEKFRRLLDDVVKLGVNIATELYLQTQSRNSRAGTLHEFMDLAAAFERATRAARHAKILQRHADGRPLPRYLDPVDDILHRPLVETIAAMYRDLGLAMAALPPESQPEAPAKFLAWCKRAARAAPVTALRHQHALLRDLPPDALKH